MASVLANQGMGPACVALRLGDAAALLGEWAEAKAYYHEALEVCEHVHFRPEIGLTRLALGELLLAEIERDSDEEASSAQEQALEHLDFAINQFRQMKMQMALERALRNKGLLKA